MKNLIILFALLLGSTIGHTEVVTFSTDNCWHPQEFQLALFTPNSGDTVWYTLNGKKPMLGSSYTFMYTGPIWIYSLEDTNYQILNHLEDFTSDVPIHYGGTSFYSQNSPGEFDFSSYAPAREIVPKETIVRACAGDCDQIFTRSYGVGDFVSDGEWEIKFIFDEPNDVWDIDSGAYAPGVGYTAPWILSPMLYGNIAMNQYGFDISGQPDSVWGENYAIRDHLWHLSLPTILNPAGVPYLADLELPANWIANRTTVLFYKNNVFIEAIDADVRPNGNGRIHRPFKSWKVKLDKKPKADIPFAVTKNFVLRIQTGGVNDRLSAEVANGWEWGPNISRVSAQAGLSVYNGAFMEGFCAYAVFSASDKKYAKYYWDMTEPVLAPFTSSSDGAMMLFVGADPTILPDWYYLISDTTWVLSRTRAEIDEIINQEAWIKYYLQKAFTRPGSSLNREAKAYYEGAAGEFPRCAPVAKDDDSTFPLLWGYGSSNPIDPFLYNHLGFFATRDTALYGSPVEWNPEDFDLLPSWAIWACIMHPENKFYYQNLLLDGFELAYRYKDTKAALDIIEEEFWYNREVYREIESISNPQDSLAAVNHFAQLDSFLRKSEQAFLSDFIEFLLPNETLSDTFTIYVELDGVGSSCGIKNGSVKVNSMEFNTSGTRVHVRNFRVEVSAIPAEGYIFSHWIEFPDSAATFMLLQSDTGNIHLTPVFVEEMDLCYLQGQLQLNEVMPWDTLGSDKLEIYNPTSDSIQLSGMYISDRLNNFKHVFSSITIQPYGYLVIQCTNSLTQQGDYNITEFALNKEGESIYLFLPDSTLVDSMRWEQVEAQVSYGYCPDAGNSNAFLGITVSQLDSVTLGWENYCAPEDTTSIREVSNELFNVWPNPALNILNLETTVDDFVIYNTWGQRVTEGKNVDYVYVNELPSGFYTLQVSRNQEVVL